MQGASKRGQVDLDVVGAVLQQELPDAVARNVIALVGRARQAYLDALPIAAVALTLDSSGKTEPFIENANDHFRQAVDYDERVGDRRLSAIPLFSQGPI